MADNLRNYFDRVNPTIVEPGEGRLGGPRPNDLYTAWNRLAKAFALTLPKQLDRCKVNRNKFMQAVK